jgi:RNA polymerase sigma-54 factor
MKLSLQLKVSQNLTMTPQLQQAIRLLQLSSLELQHEVQEALDSNMMLELEEGDENSEESTSPEVNQSNVDQSDDDSPDVENIPDDLPVDSVWEDVYEGNVIYPKSVNNSTQFLFENQSSSEKTLRDHLLWQLNVTPTSETDKAIAIAIIDALDDDGYLTYELKDIQESVGSNLEIELDEIESVLRLVQSMDPTGVGARDLQECLTLQLDQCDLDTPWLGEAKELVSRHLQLLAVHDFNQLMRRMKLDQGQLSKVVALIQSMKPRPGGQVQDAQTEYIVPDVYVKKHNGAWRVELNTEFIPNLRINTNYANMIKRADNSNDNVSLKAHLQEARWFIKSIRSRSETLLRVATSIVERQRAFLEYGEEAMKPLVLHDIAESLGMHESTISRVTTRKYMHTPRGIFELKYFFSSHLNTEQGGVCSSIAIRALIKKLIDAEAPQKPLSDSKITAILSEQGIKVARRTIAKYREAMTIPPSNERKRLI